MTSYCEKCISDKERNAFELVPRVYDVILIVDPVLDRDFAKRLIEMSWDKIPPTYRRVHVAVKPVVPCCTTKIPVELFRSCEHVMDLHKVAVKEALPVLCGKTIQKLYLGNAPAQRSCAGHIVMVDGTSVGLLPGIQDIHDADIEDRDDWFELFSEGLKNILKEVYHAKLNKDIRHSW